jgi:hypothetical protein
VTKLLLDLIPAQAEQLKDLELNVTAMDTDRARCHLVPIADHIVSIRKNFPWVGLKLWQVIYLWHREGMMFRIPFTFLFVPGEHREVYHPGERHQIRIREIQFIAEDHAQPT